MKIIYYFLKMFFMIAWLIIRLLYISVLKMFDYSQFLLSCHSFSSTLIHLFWINFVVTVDFNFTYSCSSSVIHRHFRSN